MTALLIREAEMADAEAIARVRVEGWNRAYGDFIPERLPVSWTREEQTEDWRRQLAARGDGRIHLVALEAGEILAFASGGPPSRDEVIVEGDTDAYTAQVYSIYVTPGRYGGGIGTRLLARSGAGWPRPAIATSASGPWSSIPSAASTTSWAGPLSPGGNGRSPASRSSRWPMAGPISAP